MEVIHTVKTVWVELVLYSGQLKFVLKAVTNTNAAGLTECKVLPGLVTLDKGRRGGRINLPPVMASCTLDATP